MSNCAIAEKYIVMDGLRFTRDDKTGYYRNSKTRKRLHQYIYEKNHGPIPPGYHIHHKDQDKGNNDPDNLGLLKAGKHKTLHGIQKSSDPQWKKWAGNNLRLNAIPKASEWHKSEKGREWHKNHWQMSLGKVKEAQFVCENCETVFTTRQNGHIRFCSNKCKSAWRRKVGLDNESRICEYCGNPFNANKYSKQKCCSRACSNRLRSKSKLP